MFRNYKIVLPVLIIIVGVVGARLLLVNSPKAQRKAVLTQPPSVRIIEALPQDVRIPVYSQGTIKPRTSINLAAEVVGRITEVSPDFANGGFFKAGDVLLRINPSDYELAITKAEALVASANQQLARAEAEYKQKLEEYKGLNHGKITDYALRKPQYEEARANLKAAGADLDLARVQFERCNIRAPFDGRVVEKMADIGQYVTPGMVLAHIYATDVAEVRLPLTQVQMNLLDLPSSARLKTHMAGSGTPINVRLKAETGGQTQIWDSKLVRTEATIDERNRLQYVVAEVKDPYGIKINVIQGDKASSELTNGLFVEAEIEGRLMKDIYVLPRIAIHNSNKVWLLDKENRLRIRDIELVHRGEEKAYIKQGLSKGEMIIVSPLDAVVDGMQLRIESPDNNSTTVRE